MFAPFSMVADLVSVLDRILCIPLVLSTDTHIDSKKHTTLLERSARQGQGETIGRALRAACPSCKQGLGLEAMTEATLA